MLVVDLCIVEVMFPEPIIQKGRSNPDGGSAEGRGCGRECGREGPTKV